MADRQEDLDANEPATAFKLEKARERGSVVRSTELTFAVVLAACVACVYGLGARALDDVTSLLGHALPLVLRDGLTPASALALTNTLAVHALLAIAPILFVLWTCALVVSTLQARGVFTSEPLKPDFARLSPANGLKRVFSLRSVHELWRSALKIGLSGIAMAVWAQHRVGDIVSLPTRSPRSLARSGIELIGSALTVLAGLAVLFALLDWSFNRWEFQRKMRMSRREIKDEHKEREGDPRIKSRLRELRLEWLRRTRQLSQVRSADVLLTNPTHYAVALEYRPGEMPAPMITARGTGELARRMRAEALRRGVPVVEHVALTRALFALNGSQALVPEEHFEPVARILRWVYAARGHRTSGGGGA